MLILSTIAGTLIKKINFWKLTIKSRAKKHEKSKYLM